MTSIVRRGIHPRVVLTLTICAAAVATAADGQQRSRWETEFDIDRAYLVDSTVFEPFFVTESRPLRDALRERAVHDDTPVLVLEHRAGRLALLTEQLAYHHAAQGDFKGEPWMVSL